MGNTAKFIGVMLSAAVGVLLGYAVVDAVEGHKVKRKAAEEGAE
jgi:hypothetical protein